MSYYGRCFLLRRLAINSGCGFPSLFFVNWWRFLGYRRESRKQLANDLLGETLIGELEFFAQWLWVVGQVREWVSSTGIFKVSCIEFRPIRDADQPDAHGHQQRPTRMDAPWTTQLDCRHSKFEDRVDPFGRK